VRVIPLLERLLKMATPETERVLCQQLVRIDDPRAVDLLGQRLRSGPPALRRDLLYLLGQSSQPAAEELLLEVAGRNHLFRDALQDRLTAVSALGRRGGPLALRRLQEMARRWTLSILPGGRELRSRMLEAAAGIEERSWSRRAENGKQADGT
jgi:hypothetical protein